MARTTGRRERKLPDLDPTRDPQKPGPPSVPRDSRTAPPSALPDTTPPKGSVPSSDYDSTREPGGRSDPDDKGRRPAWVGYDWPTSRRFDPSHDGAFVGGMRRHLDGVSA